MPQLIIILDVNQLIFYPLAKDERKLGQVNNFSHMYQIYIYIDQSMYEGILRNSTKNLDISSKLTSFFKNIRYLNVLKVYIFFHKVKISKSNWKNGLLIQRVCKKRFTNTTKTINPRVKSQARGQHNRSRALK